LGKIWPQFFLPIWLWGKACLLPIGGCYVMYQERRYDHVVRAQSSGILFVNL
jgi:hypothetical protein